MRIRIVYKFESTCDDTDPGYYTEIRSKNAILNNKNDLISLYIQFKDKEVLGIDLSTREMDRNGKEIFEHDICKFEEHEGVVYLKDCVFTIDTIPLLDATYPENDVKQVEIVGNVYEEMKRKNVY